MIITLTYMEGEAIVEATSANGPQEMEKRFLEPGDIREVEITPEKGLVIRMAVMAVDVLS